MEFLDLHMCQGVGDSCGKLLPLYRFARQEGLVLETFCEYHSHFHRSLWKALLLDSVASYEICICSLVSKD